MFCRSRSMGQKAKVFIAKLNKTNPVFPDFTQKVVENEALFFVKHYISTPYRKHYKIKK